MRVIVAGCMAILVWRIQYALFVFRVLALVAIA